MRIRQNRPGLALFVSGMLSGGLLVGLGLVGAQTPTRLSLRPLRLEALLPVMAKSGRSGAVLPKEAETLRFQFELSGQSAGTQLRGTWIAVDVGSVAAPNTLIKAADWKAETAPDPVAASFSLKRPKNGWPTGAYRLEVSSEGNVIHTERFVIE